MDGLDNDREVGPAPSDILAIGAVYHGRGASGKSLGEGSQRRPKQDRNDGLGVRSSIAQRVTALREEEIAYSGKVVTECQYGVLPGHRILSLNR